MSEASTNGRPSGDHRAGNGGAGVLAWRTIYSVGLGILGVLGLFVLDVVKDTSRDVGAMKVELGKFTGSTGSKLEDHDRRLMSLEHWRNREGNRP